MLKVSLPKDSVLSRAQIEQMVSEFEPGNGEAVAAWDEAKPLPDFDAIKKAEGLEDEGLGAQEEPVCNEYVKEFLDDVDHTTRLLIGYFEKYLDPDPCRIEERELCAVLHFLCGLNDRVDKILGRLTIFPCKRGGHYA